MTLHTSLRYKCSSLEDLIPYVVDILGDIGSVSLHQFFKHGVQTLDTVYCAQGAPVFCYCMVT